MIRIFMAMLCAVMLAACGSKKDASEKNFTAVINDYLSRQCIQVDPSARHVFAPHQYPAVTDARLDAIDAKARAGFDALVSAGLLTVADGSQEVLLAPVWGQPQQTQTVATKTYSLTDAGTKALVNPKGGTAFCAGHFKLKSIARFTPPATMLGQTVSDVVFTYTVADDVPTWIKSQAIASAFPQTARVLSQDQQGDLTLILTNNGWVTSQDFSK